MENTMKKHKTKKPLKGQMLKTEDTQLTIYSLKHKKHGEVSTCIQSYSPGFNTDSM